MAHESDLDFRVLVERNVDAILVVDGDGIVRFANPAAELLFERKATELVGTSFGLPAEVGEAAEVPIVGRADATRVADLRVFEMEWDGQRAHVAVLRDITEQKRTHEMESLREYDEFLALASHELKTPTATLSAAAQLLRRQLEQQGSLDPDQLRRAVERLQEQSERLARLVENLLDVARVNAGKLSLQLEPTDVARLLADVVANFQLVATHHTIVLSAPQRLEVMVDPVRLEQVVLNLVSNAIKYSPDGGRIDVELSLTRDGEVCISVRDFGLGIPADAHQRLFERFYRGHAEAEVSGLGLGLFISRHLVELHGGSISADSPPDGGARFTVLLPVSGSTASSSSSTTGDVGGDV